MPPEPILQTLNTIRMLAVMELHEVESDSHTNNIKDYLILLACKLGFDAIVLNLCSRKPCASMVSMCSLSILLANLVMTFFMAAVWLLGADRAPVSPCFLLAFASAAYATLPLPMMFLVSLDYYIEGTCFRGQSTLCKLVRNMVLTVLLWTHAAIYACCSVSGKLMELNYATGIKALVCEVEESMLIKYLGLVLMCTVIFTLLPFLSSLPQWVMEADRLSKVLEEHTNQRSNLLFISIPRIDSRSTENDDQGGTGKHRPPLWLSITLGFGVLWMPYLIVSVSCLVFGFAVPAYITVNLMWLKCTNSLLVGVIFWARSGVHGPYAGLPEDFFLLTPEQGNTRAATPNSCV